ncbi:UNVERIFIED_ORG: hypothetical protein J2W85_001203 [Ensifer adhaerens]|nr:hypothetical protein [Ensifer adhaerens]
MHVVKPQHDVAFSDGVAFLDQDLADDAAVTMLDCLQVLIDLDHSRRNDRARKLGRGSPSAGAGKKQNPKHGADDNPEGYRERGVCLIVADGWRISL